MTNPPEHGHVGWDAKGSGTLVWTLPQGVEGEIKLHVRRLMWHLVDVYRSACWQHPAHPLPLHCCPGPPCEPAAHQLNWSDGTWASGDREEHFILEACFPGAPPCATVALPLPAIHTYTVSEGTPPLDWPHHQLVVEGELSVRELYVWAVEALSLPHR